MSLMAVLGEVGCGVGAPVVGGGAIVRRKGGEPNSTCRFCIDWSKLAIQNAGVGCGRDGAPTGGGGGTAVHSDMTVPRGFVIDLNPTTCGPHVSVTPRWVTPACANTGAGWIENRPGAVERGRMLIFQPLRLVFFRQLPILNGFPTISLLTLSTPHE